jgi:hypothetical protein
METVFLRCGDLAGFEFFFGPLGEGSLKSGVLFGPVSGGEPFGVAQFGEILDGPALGCGLAAFREKGDPAAFGGNEDYRGGILWVESGRRVQERLDLQVAIWAFDEVDHIARDHLDSVVAPWTGEYDPVIEQFGPQGQR